MTTTNDMTLENDELLAALAYWHQLTKLARKRVDELKAEVNARNLIRPGDKLAARIGDTVIGSIRRNEPKQDEKPVVADPDAYQAWVKNNHATVLRILMARLMDTTSVTELISASGGELPDGVELIAYEKATPLTVTVSAKQAGQLRDLLGGGEPHQITRGEAQ